MPVPGHVAESRFEVGARGQDQRGAAFIARLSKREGMARWELGLMLGSGGHGCGLTSGCKIEEVGRSRRICAEQHDRLRGRGGEFRRSFTRGCDGAESEAGRCGVLCRK